jgi:hypothetical protein
MRLPSSVHCHSAQLARAEPAAGSGLCVPQLPPACAAPLPPRRLNSPPPAPRAQDDDLLGELGAASYTELRAARKVLKKGLPIDKKVHELIEQQIKANRRRVRHRPAASGGATAHRPAGPAGAGPAVHVAVVSS